jgi:hypothetical protein
MLDQAVDIIVKKIAEINEKPRKEIQKFEISDVYEYV